MGEKRFLDKDKLLKVSHKARNIEKYLIKLA